MARRRKSDAELAQRAWRHIADLVLTRRNHFLQTAAAFGLTPGELKAMQSLDPEQAPPTMSTLAEKWQCDASNVTWLVDRLEQNELVERRTLPEDRRVKTVALTEKGIKVHGQVNEMFYEAPDALHRLGHADLESLCEIFERMYAADPGERDHALRGFAQG